jgi:TetR/AcrR family transcriptional regulator, cholesterol catabolism regulator
MEEKVLHIFKVADRLFTTYGLRSVTMDDLAREAGVSKKTLYLHCKDKADLIRQVFQHFTVEHGKCIQEVLSSHDNAIDQWFAIKNVVVSEIADIQPSFYYDLERYFPDTFQLFEDFRNKFLREVIQDNLALGIEQGLYRQDLDVGIISTFYVNIIPLLFDTRKFPKTEMPFLKVYFELFRYHINGVATDEGRKYIESNYSEQANFSLKNQS